MKPSELLKPVFCSSILLLWFTVLSAQNKDSITTERKKVMITSSVDKTEQPSYLYLPTTMQAGKKRPLVVLLHTWSNDLEQRFKELEDQVAARGWLLLEPNFRGRNDHPEACGSMLAQHDILDAVTWMKQHYSIDKKRIYLVGFSGGGYLTMLMAALYPENWAAASAWCGISDLTQWYDFHKKDRYGEMMRSCFGGAPDQNDSIGAQFRNRSPITYLSKTTPVPLDIVAGRSDTIVPAIHSIRAFNSLMQAGRYPLLSKEDIDKISGPDSASSQSKRNQFLADPILGRRIFLHRQEGNYRITIFDGIHEWIPAAAMQWFDQYSNKQKR
jgi:predicted peptidase